MKLHHILVPYFFSLITPCININGMFHSEPIPSKVYRYTIQVRGHDVSINSSEPIEVFETRINDLKLELDRIFKQLNSIKQRNFLLSEKQQNRLQELLTMDPMDQLKLADMGITYLEHAINIKKSETILRLTGGSYFDQLPEAFLLSPKTLRSQEEIISAQTRNPFTSTPNYNPCTQQLITNTQSSFNALADRK